MLNKLFEFAKSVRIGLLVVRMMPTFDEVHVWLRSTIGQDVGGGLKFLLWRCGRANSVAVNSVRRTIFDWGIS